MVKANIEQKNLIERLKHIYNKYGVKREYHPTKDGKGVYIHPLKRKGAFIQIGKKRVGAFYSIEYNYHNISVLFNELSNVDDELYRAIKRYNNR